MTTKRELLDKIAELQAKVDAMPDDKPVNPVFYPKAGEEYYEIDNRRTWTANEDIDSPVFRTPCARDNFIKANKIMLKCRAEEDWVEGQCWSVTEVAYWSCPQIDHIFGKFASKKSAQACIDKVGKENIEWAVRVLIGVEGE